MLIVADLGNSRMKWGRCAADRVTALAALPLYDLAPWRPQLDAWSDGTPRQWVLLATNPLALERFTAWLEVNDEPFRVLSQAAELPVPLDVEKPEQVGRDRLANALAYRQLKLPALRAPAVLASAGSAVTVDHVDEAGVFRGGAILPGLAMMAKALNYYTTRLPLVELPAAPPTQPGKHTEAAIQAGIAAAVVGAIDRLRRSYAAGAATPHRLFLTGGDAAWLHQALPDAEVWPEQTLEGLRLAAQHSP